MSLGDRVLNWMNDHILSWAIVIGSIAVFAAGIMGLIVILFPEISK